ncbi:flagellar motor protein MotB [Marinomonas sp. CT5]|uniref:OmpA family protein n=1 Tax=Marinomonas sp. CT5 TaxID=2066133 RepID=UPI001BAFE592|nr:OmpA family protein [Marinomonas sp. CT5]QUX94141.1 flagellar motor protein MotB [Marinomonas sp. CT5]
MSFNIAKRTLLSSIIAASSLSTLALAQQQEGFTITPSIGYYNMDSDRDTKDDKAYSLGLGYQFNNPWAVEFVYLNADSKQNGADVDVDQYRLDGLYHLPNISTLNLTPYLAAGVGTADFSNGGNNNTQVNAGGGLKYAINDTVSLRADFRLVDDVEDHHLDNVTSLGVQMTFGSPSKRSTTSNDGYTPVEQSYTQTASEPVEDSQAETAQPETVQPDVVYEDQATQDDTVAESPMTQDTTETTNDDMAQEETVTAAPVLTDDIEPNQTTQPEVTEPQSELKLNIQFGTNQTRVEQKYYPEIEKLAVYLEEHPQSTVIIEGHTDDTGAASYNQRVSENRAKAIADVLIRTFEVSEDRVKAIGYGEEKPMVENDSPEHRQINRRVVAIISLNE